MMASAYQIVMPTPVAVGSTLAAFRIASARDDEEHERRVFLGIFPPFRRWLPVGGEIWKCAAVLVSGATYWARGHSLDINVAKGLVSGMLSRIILTITVSGTAK